MLLQNFEQVFILYVSHLWNISIWLDKQSQLCALKPLSCVCVSVNVCEVDYSSSFTAGVSGSMPEGHKTSEVFMHHASSISMHQLIPKKPTDWSLCVRTEKWPNIDSHTSVSVTSNLMLGAKVRAAPAGHSRHLLHFRLGIGLTKRRQWRSQLKTVTSVRATRKDIVIQISIVYNHAKHAAQHARNINTELDRRCKMYSQPIAVDFLK